MISDKWECHFPAHCFHKRLRHVHEGMDLLFWVSKISFVQNVLNGKAVYVSDTACKLYIGCTLLPLYTQTDITFYAMVKCTCANKTE